MITEIGQKLISALYKLSQENFNVTDDTILDKLYFHIVNNFSLKDDIATLLPKFGDWLELVITGWNNKELLYGVQIFSVRIMGYIGSFRDGFTILQDKNVLTFVLNLTSSTEIQNDSCLMVPLINAFGMFLKHQEGWKWVTETMVWKHVVKTFDEDRSIYTKRAGVKFMSQLLVTSSTYDARIVEQILNFVCKPLLLNNLFVIFPFKKLTAETCGDKEIDEEIPERNHYNKKKITVSQELVKSAKFLCDILEEMLLSNADPPVKFILICRSPKNVGEPLLTRDVLDICSSVQNHQTFSLLLLMINLSNWYEDDCQSCTTQKCRLKPVHYYVHRIIQSLTFVGHLPSVVTFCVTCLSWFARVRKKMNCSEFSCNHCAYFESTMLYCMVTFLGLHCEGLTNCLCKDGYFKSQIGLPGFTIGMNLSQKVCSECLTESGDAQKLSFQFIHLSVFGITRSLPFIEYRKNIINLFEDVQTTLSRMVNHFHKDTDLAKPIILQLLNLLSKLVERHRLPSWIIHRIGIMDTDETAVSIIIRLLRIENNDIRVTVMSLQTLIKILRFHVMPDLILKVDSAPSKTLCCLQLSKRDIFAQKLGDEHWEVRDTTLELFQAVIELAELMPWFFNDAFLPPLLNQIFTIATDDESAYVKASALNFFSKAVRCKFFDDVISPNLLLDLAIKTLLQDNMPVARKAACDLIAALYINYVPTVLNDADNMFETVFIATTKDLDWEVKKTALKFWQCTIDKHLLDGMVLFNQSIGALQLTALAKQETIARILKVLNRLGEIGCLKAIWLGINDDCDFIVQQEAQSVVESLEKLDEQWGFLDELLQSHDCDEEKDDEDSCRRLKPKDFFSQLQQENWREKLDSRRNWIENTCDNLASLLDHILDDDNRKDDCDHNAVDCY